MARSTKDVPEKADADQVDEPADQVDETPAAADVSDGEQPAGSAGEPDSEVGSDVAAVDGESGTGDHVRAAEKRAAAAATGTGRDAGYVDALLVERRGYVLRGMDERVAAVDSELARLGHEA